MMLYNLLDVTRIAVMNQSLITSIAVQVIGFFSLPVTMLSEQTVFLLLFLTLYLFRCRYLFSQLALLNDSHRCINRVHRFSHLIDSRRLEFFKEHMYISKRDAMTQKLISFLMNLVTFYVTNHQIIIILFVFSPIQSLPVILSRFCLFALSLSSAYHLSEQKVRLLSFEIDQSRSLYNALRSLPKARLRQRQSFPQMMALSIIYILAVVCLAGWCTLIEQQHHILTACGLLSSAFLLIVIRNNAYCMSVMASISSVTSTIIALPKILTLHDQGLTYLLGHLLSKDSIRFTVSTVYSILSLLNGILLFRQVRHQNAIAQLLSPIKAGCLKSPSKIALSSHRSAFDVTASNQKIIKNNR